MSKVKFATLSLIVVVAVSAIVSSLASATTKNGFFEGTLKGAAGEVEGAFGTAQLEWKISDERLIVRCTKNTLTEASIETEGKSKGAIKYGGCKLFEGREGKNTELSSCPVELAEYKFKGQLKEGSESGVVQEEIKPNSGSVFTEIKITGGSCILKGTFAIEGAYLTSLGDEAEVEKTEHVVVTTSTGSKININRLKATFVYAISNVKRTSGKGWYVD